MVRKQYIQFPAFLVNQAEQNKPSQWVERRKKKIGLLLCVHDLILKEPLPLCYVMLEFFFTNEHFAADKDQPYFAMLSIHD